MSKDIDFALRDGFQDISLLELCKNSGMDFGSSDEYDRLDNFDPLKRTILYDDKNRARGIELDKHDGKVHLRLTVPTSLSEIQNFKDVIFRLYDKYGTGPINAEGEILDRENAEDLVEEMRTQSNLLLYLLSEQMRDDSNADVMIYGVMNPIYLDYERLKSFQNSCIRLGKWLAEIQGIDAFYAAPLRFEDEYGHKIAVFAMPPGIETIIPVETDKNEEDIGWYVMSGPDILIPFDKLFDYVKVIQDYDSTHKIVIMEEDKAKQAEKECGIPLKNLTVH